MNSELVSRVRAATLGQPAWLQKKRQLAIMMAANLPQTNWQQKILQGWLARPNLKTPNEQETTNQLDYVDLPIFQAAQQYPELLQENLMEKAINWQTDQLNALHLAFLNGGRFIYIPNNTIVDKPIQLHDPAPECNYHNLIIVGANSQVTIVENQVATNQQPSYLGTELLLGDSTNVNYYQSNTFQADQNWESVRAYQAGDSVLNMYCALFDRHHLYGDFHSNLDGDGSQANFKMVGIGTHDQIQEIHTRIDNHGLHTDGEILQNGVVKDQAILNFHAVGKIYKGSHQSVSNQESRLLTLTSTSHGEADPVLLIEDNDVNAGHAASIGQVNPDQLYYLQSRGLTLMEAEILLTKGFLLPVIEKFPDQQLRNQTINELMERLGVQA
ncbi:SufD family Fe-S cluster assembly protein [uncultured Limosilactobacillus sp.]|uniref:SufB/SufD family protein n=1 Tax=uncultured Limosilactobacillus sp. TaxID=2837629 RepID=UPI0025EDE646|nr:SufD family Fe-S cluster assembly protein [uncultured Limosilactobacillus sp.]